jgi:hypothetical protein
MYYLFNESHSIYHLVIEQLTNHGNLIIAEAIKPADVVTVEPKASTTFRILSIQYLRDEFCCDLIHLFFLDEMLANVWR